MKKFYWSLLTVCLLVGLTSNAYATATAAMTQQFKNDCLTATLVTGSPTIKIALFVAANSTLSASTTTYSTTGELATAHGYTQGGNTLSSCSVASTAGSSPLAADYNCTGGLQWTATDATGITADTAVVYVSGTSHVVAIYTFTSAAATGNGATFTITPPTVSTSVRGMVYIAEGEQPEVYRELQAMGFVPAGADLVALQTTGGHF